MAEKTVYFIVIMSFKKWHQHLQLLHIGAHAYISNKCIESLLESVLFPVLHTLRYHQGVYNRIAPTTFLVKTIKIIQLFQI
jgi:hypothetical protein